MEKAMPKLSFREFIRERIGSRRPNYSYQTPANYTVMSILTDKTFPDDETDGMEIKRYIRRKQLESEEYDFVTQREYNAVVLYRFEKLWNEYKAYLKSDHE